MTQFFPTTLSSGAEGIRDATAKKESKKLDPVRLGRDLQINLDASDSAVKTGWLDVSWSHCHWELTDDTF